MNLYHSTDLPVRCSAVLLDEVAWRFTGRRRVDSGLGDDNA